MMHSRRLHDRTILDALEAMETEAFSGSVWRVTGKGRDPMRGSAADGRWSPAGEFEVLYTSLERSGALAEIGYRLSLEPVWPSRLEHEVHQLSVTTRRSVRFSDVTSLAPFGVEPARYPSYDYEACQRLAAAARFLEFDSLIVPSARSPASHLVLFLAATLDDGAINLVTTEAVDWQAWRRER